MDDCDVGDLLLADREGSMAGRLLEEVGSCTGGPEGSGWGSIGWRGLEGLYRAGLGGRLEGGSSMSLSMVALYYLIVACSRREKNDTVRINYYL